MRTDTAISRRLGCIGNTHGNKGQASLRQVFLETQEELDKAVFSRAHLIRDIGALGKQDKLFPALQDGLQGPERGQGSLGPLPIQGNSSHSFAQPAAGQILKKFHFGNVIERLGKGQANDGNILPALVFGAEKRGPVAGPVLQAFHVKTEIALEGLVGEPAHTHIKPSD